MSSYVKRKNCCLLKKSKKFFESIRQNANEIMDVVNELTIKGEFCELKDGDVTRLHDMRNVIGEVIKGWHYHTTDKLNNEVTFLGAEASDSSNPRILDKNQGAINDIDFEVDLYMVGDRLHAEPITMYKLSDVTDSEFVLGDATEFAAEYKNNPDILIEDISEFLQGIDKLEDLMKQLSKDNTRDPDTEFCCEGKPPARGQPCN